MSSACSVQALAEDDPRLVPDSEHSYGPFFSPDSTHVGFMRGSKIWRMALSGGSTCEVGEADPGDRGASWTPDGFIYTSGPKGVSRIPQSGGTREFLTTVNAARARWRIAFHRRPGPACDRIHDLQAHSENRLAMLDLGTGQSTELMDLPGHDAA
jgi:hypothetical protein